MFIDPVKSTMQSEKNGCAIATNLLGIQQSNNGIISMVDRNIENIVEKRRRRA